MSSPESQFLHQRNKQLHTSKPVEFAAEQVRSRGEKVPNEPGAKLDAYLGKIANHSLVSTIPEKNPVKADFILKKTSSSD